MSIKTRIRIGAKTRAKEALALVLYRKTPPIGLQPERLMLWLKTLLDTRDIPGDVVEIGCSAGGTAAFSRKLLKNMQIYKKYICIDTFSGFIEKQFEKDVQLGNNQQFRHMFSANSISLVRRVLEHHGAADVRLIKGDICTIPEADIPAPISACLLDVDLADPVHLGLRRIYPYLSPGGVVLIDDCHENETNWQARTGYEAFMAEESLPPSYNVGMGVVVKSSYRAMGRNC